MLLKEINKANKTICICINDFRAGGAERVASVLANELYRRGYQVVLVCFRSANFLKHYELEEHIPIYFMDYNVRGKWKLPRRVMSLRRVLKEMRPDLVISFMTKLNIYSAFSCRSLGIKNIVCERNCPWLQPEQAKERRLRDFAFWVATWRIFQTEENQQYFSRRIARKSTIIDNPIVVECEQDIPVENRNGRIVSVGRYTHQKNYYVLLKAFQKFHEKYPSYILDIYGKDCGMRKELTEWMEQNQLTDAIHLFPERKEIHSTIKDAQMFVMTSEYEGLSNALAEALALGLTCIAVDCQGGGARKILDGGNRGILIRSDVDVLTSALCTVAQDENLRKEYDRIGREYRQEMCTEKIMDRWEQTIRFVMEEL